MTPLARRFAAMMRDTMPPLDPLTHALDLGFVHHSSSSALSRAIRSAAFAECFRAVSKVLQISVPISLSVTAGALTGSFFQGHICILSIMAPSLLASAKGQCLAVVAKLDISEPYDFPGFLDLVFRFVKRFKVGILRYDYLVHAVLLISYASNPSAWAGACQ
jgi:hypothetical protein